MNWRETLIREYAGHPVRVGVNVFIAACVGVLVGHYAFGIPLNDQLAMGAMTPGLVAIVAAALLKENDTGARRS